MSANCCLVDQPALNFLCELNVRIYFCGMVNVHVAEISLYTYWARFLEGRDYETCLKPFLV